MDIHNKIIKLVYGRVILLIIKIRLYLQTGDVVAYDWCSGVNVVGCDDNFTSVAFLLRYSRIC